MGDGIGNEMATRQDMLGSLVALKKLYDCIRQAKDLKL